jgi:hypothetical protein
MCARSRNGLAHIGARTRAWAIRDSPSASVNVQQIYAYGEQRGFFKHEGLDIRIVVIKPHLPTATLLSGDTQFTAQFQTAFYAGLRGVPVKALFV